MVAENWWLSNDLIIAIQNRRACQSRHALLLLHLIWA